MAVFVNDVGRDFESEIHPYEKSPEESSVEEVDSKRILAEPEEVFV